jgi:hypothetical protein
VGAVRVPRSLPRLAAPKKTLGEVVLTKSEGGEPSGGLNVKAFCGLHHGTRFHDRHDDGREASPRRTARKPRGGHRYGRHCSGMRPSINPMSGGTLPLLASLRRHVGVPGLSPPDNPINVGSGAHAPNEHIRLADLSPAIGFLGALLDALGQDEALRSLDGHS